MEVDLRLVTKELFRKRRSRCSSSELVPSICTELIGIPRQGCISLWLFARSSTISDAWGRSDGVLFQQLFSNVSLKQKKTIIFHDKKIVNVAYIVRLIFFYLFLRFYDIFP